VSRTYAQEALAESHARSRTIVETAVDGILTIDEQGLIESCNSAATRMFGYNAEEMLSKNIHILMPSSLARQHDESFARYLRTGEARVIGKGQHELEGRHKDGTVFPIDLAVNEIRVGGRRLFTGIVRDISERKQIERNVQERTHQVERLLTQKDEFIRQLGHDLRTPLTPLVTLLPIARSLEKDPEIQGFLDVTIESAGYMKDMVQKILLLAKLNSEHTPIDITDVILQEEVVKSLASSEVCLAQNDNITLENKINKDIIVQADTTYLIEAFNSLLSNAMKYSPEGGTLTIDAIKNNGWVTVSIRDEGVGLTEEQQAKMFDEFYKGDSARHDLKSLGPGLAICKRIIERHGGNIWAESPGLGMGTKVYFTLKSGESEGPSNADTNNGR
jgi:PAS domain S-box-containing protein